MYNITYFDFEKLLLCLDAFENDREKYVFIAEGLKDQVKNDDLKRYFRYINIGRNLFFLNFS